MENMMVDEHDDIIVIDFGLCLRVPYTDPHNKNLLTDVSGNTVRRLIKAQGQGGKWEYICPEVMTRQDCDGFAIDLWSVGIGKCIRKAPK
jgi:serine/threonine protein kinase